MKVLEYGQKMFSNDPYRTTVDLYQLKHDNLLGFVVKEMGPVPSDKVTEFKFSAAGNIFCTVENEAATRNILTFYLINKVSNEGETNTVHTSSRKKGDPINSKQLLSAVEDTYSFSKTARHEVKEKNWFSKWDENGRFFCIYGRKILMDKHPRNITFYNMFGEMIENYQSIMQLDQVHFRPRPQDILKQDKLKALKKNGAYKKMYEKIYKEEEAAEKKTQNDIVKNQRKEIRDEFLNTFFIPLRESYEKDIKKYMALFPIKQTDISDQELVTHVVYNYGETLSQRKLDMA